MASIERDRERAEVTYNLYEFSADLGDTEYKDVARVLALLAAAVELGREAMFVAGCEAMATRIREEELKASRRRDL